MQATTERNGSHVSIAALSQFTDFEVVGRGGGAEVYRATRVSTGALVAVKAMYPTADPSAVARRVNREVSALVVLRGHPNVVQVEDVMQVDDRVYIVMEYLSGGSLGERISRSPDGVGADTCIATGGHIATALAAAHAAGIVHRDVKPHNVLYDGYGAAKLCDFGIAVAASATPSRTSAVSIRYASPEELDGAPLTAATDVYSLGTTLLHAAIGRPADLSERLGGIDPLVAEQPETLRAAISASMQLDPAARPTAHELAELLGATGPVATTGPAATPPPIVTVAAAAPVDRQPVVITPISPGTEPAAPSLLERPARELLERGTVAVVFDRHEVATPPPPARRWWRQPAFVVGTGAVVLVGAGLAVWATGRSDSEVTSPPATSLPARPATTVTPVSAAPPVSPPPPSTVAAATTQPAPEPTAAPTTVPRNTFGDVIGSDVVSPANPAARYAVGLATGVPPEQTAVAYSPAYYYALWSSWHDVVMPGSTAPGRVVTTERGYEVDGRPIDSIDVAQPDERVRTFAGLAGTIVPTRACPEGVMPCDPRDAALAGPAYPDSTGQAELVLLAMLDLEPGVTRWLTMLADPAERDVVEISGDFIAGTHRPGYRMLELEYASRSDAHGATNVHLTVVLADLTTLTFTLPVT